MTILRIALSLILIVVFNSSCAVTGQHKAIDETSGVCSETVDCAKPVIPVNNSLILGNADAAKKVIVFTDPDCGFCARQHLEMKRVLERRKDVVFFIKLYPLKFHKDAHWKSKSIICNKSMKMLEDNFDGITIPKTECNTTAIDDNIALAERLGINGTPTIILFDGRRNEGLLSADRLIDFVDGQGPFIR